MTAQLQSPSEQASDEQMKLFLLAQGYQNPVKLADGSWACTMPLMFTHAILHEIHEFGYGNRWCYSSLESAKEALARWVIQYEELAKLEDSRAVGADKAPILNEPSGWHRHPSSGRRVDESGKLYVNW